MSVCKCVLVSPSPTGSREEEVAIFMKGDSHDAVSEVEGLLYSVAMVNIYVNVQHSRVVLEQLKNGNDNVVHVAESRGLKLFSMVQPSRPIDGHITALCV